MSITPGTHASEDAGISLFLIFHTKNLIHEKYDKWTAKQSVFFSKSVKKSVKHGVRVFDCSRALEYAKIYGLFCSLYDKLPINITSLLIQSPCTGADVVVEHLDNGFCGIIILEVIEH